MSYPAIAIANRFIELGIDSGRPVDPMKVQKLVYLSHGWNLAFRNEPLIRERVEAWPYGPVVPDLYRELKSYRSSNITERIDKPQAQVQLDEATRSLTSQVWDKYGTRSAVSLSMMTHEPGFAWDLARRGCDTRWSSPEIPEQLIRDEFQRRRSATR